MPRILNTNDKIKKAFNKFNGHHKPDHRYSSYDYCYGYFRSYKRKKAISSKNNLEKSCLHLASYLASWGMYRGSSILLKEKSIKHYVPLITWISECNPKLWDIDANNYSDENINILLEAYSTIKNKLGNKGTATLITKIMLGVFGNVPAFDSKFRDTFANYSCGQPAFTKPNHKTLTKIKEFYDNNKVLIDSWHNNKRTYSFLTGKTNDIAYTRAKIIDMIGFGYGISK